MTQAVVSPRSPRWVVLAGAAASTALVAVLVFVFGVVVTSGVYGSRMAWLLGVVLPLAGATALLARLASGAPLRAAAKVVLVLVAIPAALVAMLLLVYVMAAAAHGLAGLLH